jgi:hypothetical protein
MQQFTVPQFIEVEPKIIGPITARQFIMFLVAAFFIFIAYKSFNFTPFVFVTVLIIGVTGVFAFLKINSRPFHFFLLNMLQSITKPNVRVWDHKNQGVENKEEMEVKYEKVLTREKYLNQARLAKVSLIVDTKGRYKGDDSDSLLYGEVDF